MAEDRIHREVVEEAPHPLAPATPMTVAQRRKALEHEFGKWEATGPIDVPETGARGWNAGDRVPRSTYAAYPELFEGRVRDLEAPATAKAAPTTKKEG